MCRIILYRILKGGIPEARVPDGAIIAARMSIYCIKDAGRKFWRRLEDVVRKQAFKLNYMFTFFALHNEEGETVAALSSNVDDLLYGFLPEGEDAMKTHIERVLCWEGRN